MSTFRQKFQATTNWVKPDPEGLDDAPRKPRRAASRPRKRPGAPVTAHRLFPALAALWFAALFGLGSLAIPGTLLGAIVVKTGLPALVPAAAPPLGVTAHLLVAFALGLLGAALGLALGLRLRPRAATDAYRAETIVTAPPPAPAPAPEAEEVYKVRTRDAHPDAPPRRPLVLTEALVDPVVDPVVEEVEEPAFEAPLLRRKRSALPGETVAEPAAPWIPEYMPGGSGVVRPLDLSTLDLDDPVEPPFFAKPEPVAAEALEEVPAPEPEPAITPESLAAPEVPVLPEVPALIAATPQLPAGFAAGLPDGTDGKWSPVASAPLENLGLVQLIERLALAIAEQKAANEAVIAADAAAEATAAARQPADDLAGVPAFEPGPFSRPQLVSPAAPAADAPQPGSAREAILRRLGALAAGEPMDAAENPGAPTPFTRPASAAMPGEAVVPIRPAEPALSLAASGPMAPVQADEALRSALATLQRMTARG